MTPDLWQKLKAQFRAQQKDLEERNGRSECKNCGTDYTQLELIIEKLLAAARVETLNLIAESEGWGGIDR